MICKRGGKDVVGTKKCLYCGKVLDEFVNTGGLGEGGQSTPQGDFTDGQDVNNSTTNTYQDYGSTYGSTGYGETSYMDYEDKSPEAFYHRYQETSSLEKGKKIIDILKKVLIRVGV